MGGSKKTAKSPKSPKGKKGGSEGSSKKGKKHGEHLVENETNTRTGEARFKCLNRDVYEGQFKITTLPQNYICRQGAGTYKTADGQTYVGQWEHDLLKGEVEITYNDGGKYIGHVEEMKYTGHGRYEFPDNSATTCNFIADLPAGEMVLVDPTGHEWRGLAGPTGASFIPFNRFLPYGPSPSPSDFIHTPDILPTSRASRGSFKGRRPSRSSKGSVDRRAGSSSSKRLSARSKASSISPPSSPTSRK